MAINPNVFIHNDDRAALEALKAIPGFSSLTKSFMRSWNEKLMYINNMSTYVRLSEKQLPRYYAMLPPICEKLGIEVPDLFLKLDVVPNAYTYGEEKPFIVLTSGLLETIPEELLPTVLAHECGHIA
ncbi:MAG: M48 family metalloprotease, partial [Erysipelotrichaceae bacterium]|nr:M48 family metalloprotease [Erysipelotrichaceae bacterium]